MATAHFISLSIPLNARISIAQMPGTARADNNIGTGLWYPSNAAVFVVEHAAFEMYRPAFQASSG